MKIKIIGIVFILSFLGGCASLSSYKKKEDYFKYWKLDTLSCKEFRTYEQACYITDSLYLKNKSVVINILGNPDTVSTFRILTKKGASKYFVLENPTADDIPLLGKGAYVDITNFIYYYNTPCINGVMDSFDYCTVEIRIISKSNKIWSKVIRCQ
jgi:hypothetical protein